MFYRTSVADRRRSLAVVVLTGAVSVGTLAMFVGGAPRTPDASVAALRQAPPPLVVTLSVSRPADPTSSTAAPPRLQVPAPAPGEVERWLAWQGEAPPATSVDLRLKPPVQELQVSAGDTLLGLLTGVGVDRTEAHAAVARLADVYDPRDLRPGQRLQVETDVAAASLKRLAFDPNQRERIELVRTHEGAYRSERTEKPTTLETRYATARVEHSLHGAATAAGVPPDVLARVIKLFSWDVDFQRDTRPGDQLKLLFDEELLTDGTPLGSGDIRYAKLDIAGMTLEAFRFERDGALEYFDRDGRSLRKFLLRTPVNGARISSGFGKRRHPILGYTRMHQGVDFAAPTGTPIYAAGSGRLVRVGRLGGYGNYIRIDHGNGYETAYAHMSRYASGMRRGGRVKQGEVIGYVGSTGRSTGPHLHFEVLKGGTQINPLKVAQPPAERLSGTTLAAFERLIKTTDRQVADLAGRAVAAGTPRATAASDG